MFLFISLTLISQQVTKTAATNLIKPQLSFLKFIGPLLLMILRVTRGGHTKSSVIVVLFPSTGISLGMGPIIKDRAHH